MPPSGLDENKLKHAFLEEADELVQKLNESLLKLETDSDNRELVNEVFRLIHSLKSEAALLGYSVLSELSHRMEDVLGLARDGAVDLDKQALDRVFAGADLISGMLSAISHGGSDAQFDIKALMDGLGESARVEESAGAAGEPAPAEREKWMRFSASELRQLSEARDRQEDFYRLTLRVDENEPMKFPRAFLVFTALEQVANVVKTVPPMSGDVADALYGVTEIFLSARATDEPRMRGTAAVDQIKSAELVRIPFPDLVAQTQGGKGGITQVSLKSAESGRKSTAEKTTIRVDTKKLDDLWKLIAELIQQKSRITRVNELISRGVDTHAVREELGETFDSLDKISTNMQEAMMETRMIPISVIFNKFPRLVRDLSRKLGKSVELAVSGEDTEIDRGIVEAISDPLTHIIRNSLDHGIEFPEERAKRGKPEKGKVRISAYQQGRGIVIELEDDGKGIDVEEIRRKAAEIGVQGVGQMDDTQALDLIFMPGFSTKEEVSDLSGRGVGMDVVATKIKGDLKGAVTVNTVPGEGTLITLVLPVTLTIMNALLVRADTLVYAIPIGSVESTEKVLNTEIRGEEGKRVWSWQGEEIPLYYLGSLQDKGLRVMEEYFAVILSYGMDRGCLIVDELMEEREVVIKPIDDLLNYRRLFSGISVLEDGTPVYILDTSFVQEGAL